MYFLDISSGIVFNSCVRTDGGHVLDWILKHRGVGIAWRWGLEIDLRLFARHIERAFMFDVCVPSTSVLICKLVAQAVNSQLSVHCSCRSPFSTCTQH